MESKTISYTKDLYIIGRKNNDKDDPEYLLNWYDIEHIYSDIKWTNDIHDSELFNTAHEACYCQEYLKSKHGINTDIYQVSAEFIEKRTIKKIIKI